MWGIIGTWKMSYEGIKIGSQELESGKSVEDAIEQAVIQVEDTAEFTSVGYGGLPNEDGLVELDAAFMNGTSLSIGAVAGIRNFKNPCQIAKKLMKEPLNNFLVGKGAEKYALQHNFEQKNMLTEASHKKWVHHKEKVILGEMRPYIGHDTVCVIGLDQNDQMATCTSTSGLFFKKVGRVGDSPIPGAGYYVDSEVGGACATGLGEDLMKGAISYEIVRLMEMGLSPMKACNHAIDALHDKLTKKRGKAGDLSVIAMNAKGEFGASTNIEKFPFVIATEKQELTLFIATYKNGKHEVNAYEIGSNSDELE